MLLMSGFIAVTSCSTVRSGTTSSEFCSVLLGTGGVSQGVSCVLVLTCSGPEQSGWLSVRAVVFFLFIPNAFFRFVPVWPAYVVSGNNVRTTVFSAIRFGSASGSIERIHMP